MKKPKRKKKGILWLLAAVILIAASGFAIWNIEITNITVVGNSFYSEDDIKSMLFNEVTDRKTVFCFIKDMLHKQKDVPFIQSYEIDFINLNTVEVVVYEKGIVGCFNYMDNYLYFDKDGIIVDSAADHYEGIPIIEGIYFDEVVMYHPISVENSTIFEDILNLTQLLKKYELSIDKIRYDLNYNVTLTMDKVRIILGSYESMEGKIVELYSMKDQLTGRSGTLYLDQFDESKKDTVYRFQLDE